MHFGGNLEGLCSSASATSSSTSMLNIEPVFEASSEQRGGRVRLQAIYSIALSKLIDRRALFYVGYLAVKQKKEEIVWTRAEIWQSIPC